MASRIGAQLPDNHFIPLFHTNLGEDAVDLAAVAGLFLDPWQQEVLKASLGCKLDGKFSAPDMVLIVPRQNGKGSVIEARELASLFLLPEKNLMHSAHEFKALDVSTPILTTAGWSTMGELRDGDEVYAPDGQPTKVIAHPVRYDRPCFKLKFDDGQEVVADAEHLWQVWDCNEKTDRVLTTQEIVNLGVCKVQPRTGRNRRTYRFRVSVPEPLQNDDVELPIDPWLLGYWLGDGDSGGGRLTVGIEDYEFVCSRLDALGLRYSENFDKRNPRVRYIGIYGLRTVLRETGLLNNKHIPESYMLGSERQRRELLAGLMDSDGSATGHQISICMNRKPLMESVLSLVRSVGYKATMIEFTAKIDGRDAGLVWRVQMPIRQDVSPFAMPRKSDRVVPRNGLTSRATHNAIVAVDPVESRPTRCITVTHESSLYCVGTGFVPTHNTAQEGFKRLRTLIEGCPDLMDEGDIPPTFKNSGSAGTVIEANGSRIIFAARSKGSGRGFTIDTVIFDEAYDLPEDALDAMGPMQSAVPNPQTWFVSSTGMDDSVVLRRMSEAGKAKSPGMGYFEWKAEDGCKPGDRDQWYKANPSLGIRIQEDFLAGQYTKMSELGFAREHLGLWADTEVQAVITQAQWADLLDDESKIAGKMSFALDVAPDMSSAAVYVAGENADGLHHVECAAVFDGTDGVADYLKLIQEKYKPKSIAVDPGGPAGALVPELNNLKVNFRSMTSGDVLSACGQFFNMVTGNKMRHRTDDELADAIKGGIKRMVGAKGAWAWTRKSVEFNITYLVAATYALYAFTAFEEETPKGGRVW